MKNHPFDKAIKLAAQEDGSWLGHTSASYANMVGPFAGVTAAQALNAVPSSSRRARHAPTAPPSTGLWK